MGIVINLTMVLAAAIVQMVLGFLWYGPLFGKVWTKLAGFSQQDMEAAKKQGMMGRTYAMAFGAALLMSYVLAYMVALVQPLGWLGGTQLGFLIWLGFIATSFLNNVLWMGKSKILYMIDIGYYFILLILNGVILTVWQ